MAEEEFQDHFFVKINEKEYKVGSDISPTKTLLDFLRNTALLKGTKALCYQGGCGICTVIISRPNKATGKMETFSAPSCKVPIYSCAGACVSTIEHLGSREKGLDDLQKALAGFCGTQCGYCSPAMIMTAKGQMLNESGTLTMKDIERSLDGNLCRCTGYRPILDAFKSFASDAPQELKEKMADIEDSYMSKCPSTGKPCRGSNDQTPCGRACPSSSSIPDPRLRISHKGVATWYRPQTLMEAYEILEQKKPSEKLRIVSGSTTTGILENDRNIGIFIDTAGLKELATINDGDVCTIGGSVTIARCIEVFEQMAQRRPRYLHLKSLAEHWKLVGNTGIRNIASWAGNLMLKHSMPAFPSDIWLTLVACEARILVGNSCSSKEIDLEEFLQFDMTKSLILKLILPPKDNFKLRTFKIMSRAVNARACLNAAFAFQVDADDGFKVTSKPNILYGGLSATSIRSTRTEEMLYGTHLSDGTSVLSAIRHLEKEMIPEPKSMVVSVEYGLSLCQSLLYKTILDILGDSCPPLLRSGGEDLKRPVSSGEQFFDSDEDKWPIGPPINKVESSIQVTGEIEYVDDIPPVPGELYGAFVQSKYARAKIKSIDASECLKQPGVIDFVTAEDIPGENSFVNEGQIVLVPTPDPIFASSEVVYAGQAIGLVVGETKEAALDALQHVQVFYEDIKEPVITIEDAITQDRTESVRNFVTFSTDPLVIGNPIEALSTSKNVIEGELHLGTQFHHPTEPLSSRTIPTDDGFDVCCTTQWTSEAQKTIAACLGLPTNSINISVKRLGGGFGSKITRAHVVSCASAVAANKLQKPVRVTLDLTTHMTLVGWREPYYTKYKVGFDDNGLLNVIDAEIISDVGLCGNESSAYFSYKCLQNVYHCPNWKVTAKNAYTNTATNTFCRAPGYLQTMATTENIMEHIAHYLQKDPSEIRKINLTDDQKPPLLHEFSEDNLVRQRIFPLLEKKSNLAERRAQVDAFNKANRWKKKGISFIPMYYHIPNLVITRFNVQVVIYDNDGSVAITHSGIEMGQGINTKVIQAAANILGISTEIIKVKPTNTFTGANCGATQASYTSDLNVQGVIFCCKEMKKRMDPVAAKMQEESGGEIPSWADLVTRCRLEQVDLIEKFYNTPKSFPPDYDVWAAVCVEVVVDVLTGQHLALRVDIMEDCGRSMNPLVDVGQVEGAFVMGLGYFTTEKLTMDPITGQKLSVGVSEYRIPTALDIPVDFRVSFLPGGDNPESITRSKSAGEPGICLSYGIVTALRNAIQSARKDVGRHDWFQIDIPATPDVIQRLCLVDAKDFSF